MMSAEFEFTATDISISDDELRAHVHSFLDSTQRDLIALRSSLVGFFFLLFAMINYLTMEEEIRLLTTWLALAVSASLFVMAVIHRFTDYAPKYANHLSFLEICILHADGMAFLLVTNDIMSGFGVFIMVVSTGIFLTRIPWIIASVVMLSGSWVLVLWNSTLELSLSREGLMWVSSGIFCFFFYFLRLRSARRLSEFQLRQDAYRSQLEEALQHIKNLSGLLPICAQCKNIRDEEGNWQQIEEYVMQRSQAEFTHSVCPDCLVILYPDYVK